MRRLITTVALAVALVALTAGAASADAHGAKVTIVHGVPGLTVDICVNGSEAIENFEFKDIASDVPLAAGSYDLGVTVADTGCGAAVLTADDVALTDGLNASVVAHLDGSGTPTLSIFVNDTSGIDAGKGRATVRHTAQAPTVDVWANGSLALFTDLANGAEKKGDVDAATYSIELKASPSTEGDAAAVGPVDLPIPEGTNRIVYAVGVLGDSFDLLIQDIEGLASSPGGVDSGSGDLAASDNIALMLLLAAAAVTLVAIGGRTLVYRRGE